METDLLAEYPGMVPVSWDGDDAWLKSPHVLDIIEHLPVADAPQQPEITANDGGTNERSTTMSSTTTAPSIGVPRPAWATTDNGWSSDGGDGWNRIVSHRIGWPDGGGIEIEQFQAMDRAGNVTSDPIGIQIDLYNETLGGEASGDAAADAREFAAFLVQAAELVEKSSRLAA
ncbi:hypothetical protein [Cellulosimicrobium protaetiae]|uniref:Uncharacterized protein n=1 Tax=Cellulosimicrobium protaetiae TaxID=2587808 RepID=A0A6M5UD26_9MICO|nr:hypothetical protein [Cellulosimicrobium protaetiae]QJW36467.1 hypothetical protein FIC82_009940 [Cellulosimicrobium protaetiae]